MIAASIRAVLIADVTIANLVDGRVYSARVPQSKQGGGRPYIAFRSIGSSADETMEGKDGLIDGLFQVDCIASTQDGARSLADATRPALSNYAGTIGGHEVKRFRFEGELDDWEMELEGGEPIIGRVTQTWGVWYCEPNNLGV